MRFVSSVALLIAVAACSEKSNEQVACTMEARPAIAVTAVDSVTGAPLARSTVAVARQDGFADTLRGVDSTVSGAHERPGTFRVTLVTPGYRDWVTDVAVTRDECHVQTAQLRARLVRR
jgi:hypothetical protein